MHQQRTQCTSSLWSFTPYGVHVTSVTLSEPCSIPSDPTSSGHTTSESTILYARVRPMVCKSTRSPGFRSRMSSNMLRFLIPLCAVSTQCVEAPPTGRLVPSR